VTARLTSDSAKISAINHWVYRNQGFAKNDRFFLVPALGPTPNQVLASGGDCGDKSRLVSGDRRLMVGLRTDFPCQDCGQSTVVRRIRRTHGRRSQDVSLPNREQ
jgi:hypothetical protein